VLYRDADLIVLDKPAGLACHPGPSTPDSLEALLPQLCFGWKEPPRLVHRLDRDTSGCLVLARHEKALRKLARMFENHAIAKTYWAIVEGDPGVNGVIDAPLAKLNSKAGWHMAVSPKKGQPAVTRWRKLGGGNGLSWLELTPETGRTHQIRVHCAHLGCPLLGDAVYGKGKGRLMLHSRSVAIPALTENKQPVAVEAAPPAHMRAALESCGWRP
jgi:RluA family pseudouridine synthase